MSDLADTTLVHASSVAIHNQAVLIIGPAGSGKSTLALDLISRGGGLIADDQTRLRRENGVLIASAPPAIAGRIEARGIGLLACPVHRPAPLRLVVDLAQPSTDRLPPERKITFLGVEIELILGGGLRNLAPAIHLILSAAKVT